MESNSTAFLIKIKLRHSLGRPSRSDFVQSEVKEGIYMKLADLATGPDWIIWTVFVVFAVLSIILLSGHGSWFISGYNMASKEEKEKYDEKKLCRTTGIGMSIIAILILIMGLLENSLPASFVYIALGIILVDVVVIIILGNTLCRK